MNVTPTDRWARLRAEPWRFDLAVAVITLMIGTALTLGAPDRTDPSWPDVAAGVGAFVLVLFRRRQPPLFLGVALGWVAIHVAVFERPTAMVFAVIVLLITTSIRLDRWAALTLGAAIGVSLYLVLLVGNDTELGDARAVIGIAWTAMAVGIGDAVRSWRRYRDAAAEQLRTAVLASEARSRQTVSEERLMIARELHDLLAHNLSVMNVQTGAALHLLRSDPDRAETALVTAREAGRSVLHEVGGLLAVLRRDGEEPTESTGSLPTVEQLPNLVDTMRNAGLEVRWTQSGEARPLSDAVSLAAYRICQEALTNAARHGIGPVAFATDWTEAGMRILVANRRAGNEASPDNTASESDRSISGGHGLIGIRERVSANGGDIAAGPDGEWFVVSARLPAVGRDGVADGSKEPT